jgi:hypothetical protein
MHFEVYIVSASPHLKMQTDQVSGMLCFFSCLEFWMEWSKKFVISWVNILLTLQWIKPGISCICSCCICSSNLSTLELYIGILRTPRNQKPGARNCPRGIHFLQHLLKPLSRAKISHARVEEELGASFSNQSYQSSREDQTPETMRMKTVWEFLLLESQLKLQNYFIQICGIVKF